MSWPQPNNNNNNQDAAPPYEAIASNSSMVSDSKSPIGQSFHQRIAEIQTARINHIIDNHILPFMLDHAESGFYKAMLALIPSDAAVASEESVETLLNVPDGTFSRVSRIDGQGNTAAFWQQPRMVKQLETALVLKTGIPTLSDLQSISSAPAPRPLEPERKSSFWRRASKPSTPQQSMFQHGNLGWRAADSPPELSSSSLILRTEDVFFRVSDDTGLYQIRPCQAIVVHVRLCA